MSSDLATLTAILYAARYQRRIPESATEKRWAIAESFMDAKLIMDAVEVAATVITPEPPPPSPGTIGRIAEATAVRRRDEFGRWIPTGSD